MGVIGAIREQIRKADARCGNWDAEAAAAAVRQSTPEELNAPARIQARLKVADEVRGSPANEANLLERIINGNELQDVNYLARGMRAARAVARVEIGGPSPGYGTGFLVTPRLLLTNHHVLPTAAHAQESVAEFGYERDVDGRLLSRTRFRFLPGDFFYAHEALDFALVAVAPVCEDGRSRLDTYGFLPLVETLGKAVLGEWLTIVQHPNGEPKQVCVRENQLLRIDPDVVWYSTDTLGGASGSPVFNNDWLVVALHHSGVPERKNGRIQTIDGRDWTEQDGEARIQWVANEGIRVSRIVQHLREVHGSHPLIVPVLSATVADAFGAAPPAPATRPESLSRSSISSPSHHPMNTNEARRITVQLEVSPSGAVSVVPTESVARSVAPALEVSPFQEVDESEKIRLTFDSNYAKRQGYRADLLGQGSLLVNRPVLSKELEKSAAKFLSDGTTYELNYYNHTIVMHAERRLAIYSAASVRGDQRFKGLERKNYARESDWRRDERISAKHQLENFYYKGNRFDRGHLSRNEDLEFGPTPEEAVRSALDTFHYTNIAPQHDAFNRNNIHKGDIIKGLEISLWGDLEKHLLEKVIFTKNIAVQVISGPIFDEGDPFLPQFDEIPYPVRFWKVVACVDDAGKLFATAFLLDQSAVVERLGLAEAAPIGAFKTYQVRIEEIERLTDLRFTSGAGSKLASLSAADPLQTERGLRRLRTRSRRFRESTAADYVPEGYLPLDRAGQMVVW